MSTKRYNRAFAAWREVSTKERADVVNYLVDEARDALDIIGPGGVRANLALAELICALDRRAFPEPRDSSHCDGGKNAQVYL